jgi:hypothetical protein
MKVLFVLVVCVAKVVALEYSSDSEIGAIFSAIIGWAYFAAWSLSFYPQVYDNFKRKRFGIRAHPHTVFTELAHLTFSHVRF